MLEPLKYYSGNISLAGVFDILLVAAVLYLFFVIFRRTRALNLLLIIIFMAVIVFVSQKLGLVTLNWLIKSWWQVWVIALLVIFQPDLRRAVGQMGRGPVFSAVFKGDQRMVQETVQAVRQLLRRKLGGLIVIERDDNLDSFIREGHATIIDSDISNEMLVTIFSKRTPLHDGAVIVRRNRIIAAGCILPLTSKPRLKGKLGTRHMAALGMSEESDAIVIVVSEDKCAISVAVDGKMTQKVEIETLSELLEQYITHTKR